MNYRSANFFVAAAVGAGSVILARLLAHRGLLARFRRDSAALNEGDYRPLLSAYAKDAVLHFNEGDHRWAGTHRGRASIERFLRNFVGAKIKGEIRDLYFFGPPQKMTLLVRFDDHASDDRGEVLYRNSAVLLVKTKWGRVVYQEDFYEDTGRILDFEARLRELGVEPAT
jgi:ketosteroid isomerase-like protein